jgi:Family of unknown function (DUF5631)/Family of unknown function (DUF5632)
MIFPRGEWSSVLVGDQWPYDQDILELSHSKINRGNIKTGYVHFADMLCNAQTGPLAEQQGHTADDLRNAFRQGENHARQVAEKNGVKESAYGTAYDSMLSLQHDLTGLAEEGNKQIKEIQDSKQPAEAKVTQIVAAIHQYRALANLAAAKYGGNVLDAIQRVLDEQGTGQSARQFAQAYGVDTGHMFRQPEDERGLADQVRELLDKPPGSQTNITSNNLRTQTDEIPKLPFTPPGQAPGSLTTITSSNLKTDTVPPPGVQASVVAQGSPSNIVGANLKTPPQFVPGPAPPAPPSPPRMSGAPMVSTPGLPSAGAGSPLPAATVAPLAGGPLTPPGPAQGLTPGELMHSFDKGLQAGEPLSAAAGAVPPAPMSPTEPQAPPTTPSAGLSAPAHAAAFDSPPPVAHAPAPDATPAPPVVAGPAAPAGPVAATPPPTGPLPAYASDLRPTISAATTPAATPSPPPSATPGSASVHPSAGQGSAGQPTVMRQATSPGPPSSPSSLGTQAVAATATGAVAGAASANATARARLQRLVAAVARQQPRLAWAAGDRADNATVLTTDLASGWIPPGIDLPAAVTLLPPERRRGDLDSLLGEVSVAAGYTPIHHIPEEDEPVPTSPRPRRVPDIDELGWELNQATQWRDGLPQLAHTMAKAASAGTGVLDKEVELLHEYLAAISARVLDSYPDHVDSHDVGNWQLLAAIDALVAGDKSAANYHLAWFQACSTTTTGQAGS